MKCAKTSMLLYAVTDRTWLGNQTLEEQVEQCLAGGATFIQLREKELEGTQLLEEALAIKALCAQYRVPFVINDHVEAAIACGADGVHVGQHDMEAGHVRLRMGADKIVGVSVQTARQALLAEKNGADYLGVGAVFTTLTKPNADLVSHETLKQICNAVKIPVVAIGGIDADHILALSGTGVDGVAVVSAIFAQPDIKAATEALLLQSKEVVANNEVSAIRLSRL